jgi:hypothetical protein
MAGAGLPAGAQSSREDFARGGPAEMIGEVAVVVWEIDLNKI